MPAEPLNLAGFSFTDIEAEIAKVLDPVTKLVEAVDHSPFAGWLIPAQYRTMLDDFTKILEAADAFLHKTP